MMWRAGDLKHFPYFIILLLWSCFSLLALTTQTQAAENFLKNDEAFDFNVRSISNTQAELNWKIAPEYYLYKYQFSVKADTQKVDFVLPTAISKHDEFFGDTEVYYQHIGFQIPVQPNLTYQVTYQGCAEKGLCYPLSQTEFETDSEGLVILQQVQNQSAQSSLWTNVTSTQTTQTNVNEVSPNSEATASDQQWSEKLSNQSLGLSILIFLGLGCLLAFTPCSLPMLPILSSLLIRKHEGVKAIFISLTFVLCMASVYALLGVLAASAGSNLQRWLQQPIVLIVFSSIFIIFALNLFGVFELKLPQKWSNRLDQLQANQKGGTLIGAGVMGILSALLVGPCMTAPLAGTLLYISQTQNVWAGAGLLFSLGLGMGIPLILLTLVGQKAVPKPGVWMNYVRHVFAFLMLGLSLYFIRPLLSEAVFNVGLLCVVIALMAYLVWLIVREKKRIRLIAIVALLAISALSVWQSVAYWSYQQAQTQTWQVVRTKAELETALEIAKQQNQVAVVDLYADWCIACQPLEREVWSHPQVQIALDSVVKIKLDLSEYAPEQKEILQQYALLGPPTALFINAQGEEERALRLTGSFNRDTLLAQIKTAQN